MYKLALILKYLRKRRIAWVSLIAVMLCTTMVIVVISVMGGWLRMFRESFHGLTGDVIVSATSLTGFPHYQEMIEEIEKIPEVRSAVPTIRTFGLINIANVKTDGVQVLGIPADRIADINKFRESLHRQYNAFLDEAESADITPKEREALLAQADRPPSFDKVYPDDFYRSIMPEAKGDVARWPGMIAGAGVVNIRRDSHGNVVGRHEGLYQLPVKLTVLGISTGGFSVDLGDKAERNYWLVDDSHTRLWQYDSTTVYVPFEVVQVDLGMDEQTGRDAVTGERVTIPARTSDIHVGLVPGVDLNDARAKVDVAVKGVLEKYDLVRTAPLTVETWEESQSTFLSAIENEVTLVTFLFSLISVVAVFLIFCIFYMIVVEKTRDIGIIKSVGATSAGVGGIFLGYGLAIGIVGSLMGLLMSYLIVHNINYLHAKVSDLIHRPIWDPAVYAFDTIPNTMDPFTVTVILIVAVIASVVGALIPAIRAARMRPVEALRWE